MSQVSTLAGSRVLLVEDESLIAMLAEDILVDLGCTVLVAMRLDQGLTLAEDQSLDAAVLDVNLGSTRSFPIAEALRRRRVPFLFATGYGQSGISPEFADQLVIQKPFQATLLEAALHQLLARQRRRVIV